MGAFYCRKNRFVNLALWTSTVLTTSCVQSLQRAASQSQQHCGSSKDVAKKLAAYFGVSTELFI